MNNVSLGTILLVVTILLNIISFAISYSIYKNKDF